MQPNTDEIFIPPKLFPRHEAAIAKREVDANTKSDIARLVYANLWGHNQVSNKCLKKASKKLVNRWSPLKDPNDPENVRYIFGNLFAFHCESLDILVMNICLF